MFFNRTFHPDEANQAFTTGRLLETGVYTYKPTDHHGPTLYYAAAPLQKAFGHNDIASLDGDLLRCTPLVFAVLALVLAFLAVRKATKSALSAVFACTLLAAAPIFAFYSTDFIQEMLLAAFSVGMFWSAVNFAARISDDSAKSKLKPGSWALIFGISAGLAFATKETSVLTFASALISILLTLKLSTPSTLAKQAPSTPSTLAKQAPSTSSTSILNSQFSILNSLIFVLLAFILTSILLFSAFCADWQGVYNAFVAAPLSYFHRAAGDAAAGGADWHVHPWWWYAKLLFLPGNILYSLAFIPLVLLPLVFRFRASKSLVFLSIHSVLLFAIYSIIPYKTPWCMLQVAVPLVLAYGILLGEIASNLRNGRAVAFAAFVLPLALFIVGDLRIMRDPDARDIPYNYAHASPQVKDLAACVASAYSAACTNAPSSTVASPSNSQFIAVALPPCDTWPFPWYNRALEPHTGYWTDFSAIESLAKSGVKPAVVVCPAEEGHKVMPLFPHLNRTRRFEMRPRVRIRAFWSER